MAKYDVRIRMVGTALLAVSMGFGCASTASQEGASSPASAEEVEEGDEFEGVPEATSVSEEEEEPQASQQQAPPPDPEFREGMSVDEAIAVVPQSAQRVNIEQDALAAPLMKTELYEPCGLKGNQRFQLRVAVWNGRAVGLDVITQPKNEKLDQCLREQVASVTWPDKVRSLNTVEFSY